jgi:hypothetical protein
MSPTTKTVLLVGGAAVGAFVLARLLAPKPTTSVSLFGNGAGVSQGLLSGLGSFVSSLTKTNFSGMTPQEVRGSDLANTLSYDSQGTYDQPVYGMAGLDY